MESLHFKDCSEIFNPFIQKSKSLKIGLSAYKALVDKRLLEFTKVVHSIYSGDGNTLKENGHSWNDLVPVTIYKEGVNYIAKATLNDLTALANGLADKVQVNFCKPADGSFTTTGVDLDLESLNHYVTDKISCLQGQSVIFGAAIKQDLNTQFDINTLLSELTLRGFSTSDYLQSLVAGVSAGMTWADILALIAGNVAEPTTNNNGYWVFDPEDFSNTNSLVLGITSIASTIASFFSSIEFDIRKIGDYFKNLWKGITDLATWVVTSLAGDLLTDYVVKQNYTLEGLNVPVAKVSFNLDTFTSSKALNDLYMECQQYPDKMTLCKGTVLPADNAYNGAHYGVDYIPDISKIINTIDEDFKDGTTKVIPWSRGFIIMTRKSSDMEVSYFLGDFKAQNVNSGHWGISSDGTISAVKEWINYKEYEAVTFKSNQDFVDWFTSLLNQREDGEGYTIVADDDFIGIGSETGNSSTLYEDYLDMTINPEAISGPGSLVDQLRPYYFNGVESRLAAQFVLTALVYNNIFTGDKAYGRVRVRDMNNGEVIHTERDFPQTSFLPYESNHMISFKYHAQSDSERASEVIDAIKRLAIAAAAIGTAITAVKVNKALKIRSYTAQHNANLAWARVVTATPENKAALVETAYKLQRRANIWTRVSSLIGGNTVNSALQNSLAGVSIPYLDNANIELLYTSIVGKTL